MKTGPVFLLLGSIFMACAMLVQVTKLQDRVQSLEQQLLETQHDLRACRMGQ